MIRIVVAPLGMWEILKTTCHVWPVPRTSCLIAKSLKELDTFPHPRNIVRKTSRSTIRLDNPQCQSPITEILPPQILMEDFGLQTYFTACNILTCYEMCVMAYLILPSEHQKLRQRCEDNCCSLASPVSQSLLRQSPELLQPRFEKALEALNLKPRKPDFERGPTHSTTDMSYEQKSTLDVERHDYHSALCYDYSNGQESADICRASAGLWNANTHDTRQHSE